jgi:hypothetical protein
MSNHVVLQGRRAGDSALRYTESGLAVAVKLGPSGEIEIMSELRCPWPYDRGRPHVRQMSAMRMLTSPQGQRHVISAGGRGSLGCSLVSPACGVASGGPGTDAVAKASRMLERLKYQRPQIVSAVHHAMGKTSLTVIGNWMSAAGPIPCNAGESRHKPSPRTAAAAGNSSITEMRAHPARRSRPTQLATDAMPHAIARSRIPPHAGSGSCHTGREKWRATPIISRTPRMSTTTATITPARRPLLPWLMAYRLLASDWYRGSCGARLLLPRMRLAV